MDACYFDENGRFGCSGELWKALAMEKRMECSPGARGNAPFVVSFAGAGGKTSLITRLAWEGQQRGLHVLVLTTTHMQRPVRFGVLDSAPEAVGEMLQKQGLAVAGHLEESGKISFQGWEYYRKIISLADLVLVEADGSKRLPVKVPRRGEPVVPENTKLLVCVSGLSALGKDAGEVCFCLKEARELLGLGHEEKWTMEPEQVEQLMKKGYLEPWREKAAGKEALSGLEVIPVFNQGDTRQGQLLGKTMLERMGEKKGLVTGNLPGTEEL